MNEAKLRNRNRMTSMFHKSKVCDWSHCCSLLCVWAFRTQQRSAYGLGGKSWVELISYVTCVLHQVSKSLPPRRAPVEVITTTRIRRTAQRHHRRPLARASQCVSRRPASSGQARARSQSDVSQHRPKIALTRSHTYSHTHALQSRHSAGALH